MRVYFFQVCWRSVHKHTASVGGGRPSCGQLGFVTTLVVTIDYHLVDHLLVS